MPPKEIRETVYCLVVTLAVPNPVRNDPTPAGWRADGFDRQRELIALAQRDFSFGHGEPWGLAEDVTDVLGRRTKG
jgi:hypothetical protein